MLDLINFEKVIKNKISEQGLTLKKASEQLGINYAFFSNILNGHVFSLKTRKKICSYFNVDFAWLCSFNKFDKTYDIKDVYGSYSFFNDSLKKSDGFYSVSVDNVVFFCQRLGDWTGFLTFDCHITAGPLKGELLQVTFNKFSFYKTADLFNFLNSLLPKNQRMALDKYKYQDQNFLSDFNNLISNLKKYEFILELGILSKRSVIGIKNLTLS